MMYHKTSNGLVPVRDHRDGPCRIVRFVGGSKLPGVACDFDNDKNILRINSDFFLELTSQDQTRLFRSRETVTVTRWGKVK